MFDIDKLLTNVSPVKQFLLGLIISSLFWYFNIFIWGKHLILEEPMQVPIIIAICLGFLWYTFNLVYLTTSLAIIKPKEDRKVIIDVKALELNIFASVLTLSAMTGTFKLIHYIITFTGDEKIFNFHVMTFCEMLAMVILVLFARNKHTRLTKEPKVKSKS